MTDKDGWKIIHNSYVLSSYSFGYHCFLDSVLIIGGYSQSGIQNSYVKLYLNDLSQSYNISSIISPPERYGASFSTVSNFSILFGGRDEANFYQDLWKYQFIVDKEDNLYDDWTLMNAQGIYPTSRAGHSAGVQGNYIVIVGGYDANYNILSDYWLLETTQMKWTQIIPNPNSVTPPPLTNACVVLDLPYFYIIGGRTVTGLTYDFWQYNFTDNQFYLRRSTDVHTDTPLFKHSCYLSIKDDNKYVYVFFGSQSIDDNPYCGITRFNITDLTQVTTKTISTYVTEFTCRTESAFAFFQGALYGFGGQSFGKYVFNDVFIVSLDPYEEWSLYISLSEPLYSSAFTQLGDYFTFYSGLNNAYFPQIKPSNSLYSFYFIYSLKFCGSGFVYNESLNRCSQCPLGSYSGIGDSDCKPCDEGFFSNFEAASDITQCFPCPLGSFSSTNGSSKCIDCESDQYCPIGSKTNSTFTVFNENSYPKIYQPLSNDSFKSICYFYFIALLVLYQILWIFSRRFRLVLICYDFFKQVHYRPRSKDEENFDIIKVIDDQKNIRKRLNKVYRVNGVEDVKEVEELKKLNGGNEVNEVNVPEPNRDQKCNSSMEMDNLKYAGGFCTGLTIVAFLYLIPYSIGLFFIGNIYETQGVEPASSLLQQKQSLFINHNILVHVRFNSYAGNCSIDPSIDSSLSFFEVPLYKNLGNCSFIYIFQKPDIFATGDNILFKFDHKNSFTSDITIYLEVDSEFSNQKSGLVQSLNSTSSYVFRGNIPTVFYYTLTPAYFKETSLFNSIEEGIGFRLSQNTFPEPGSQYRINQIYFNPGLSVKIELTVADSAVISYLVPILDITTFIVSFFAQLNGTFGFLGFVMLSCLFIQRQYNSEKFGFKPRAKYQELLKLFYGTQENMEKFSM